MIVIGLLFLLGCQVPSDDISKDIPAEKFCTSDEDCVPRQCCHPDEAVNKEYAPDCGGIFCTQECKPGTLDCNQGEIKCINNTCTAIIYEE